jgi:hypothetical protein
MIETKLISDESTQTYKLYFEDNIYTIHDTDYNKIYNFIKQCKDEASIVIIEDGKVIKKND